MVCNRLPELLRRPFSVLSALTCYGATLPYPYRRVCIVEMKSRVEYLRRLAEEFRRAGELSRNKALRGQLQELADQCEAIAANIAENLPIHERLRESQSTRNSS